MDIDQLRQMASEHGVFVLEKEDGIHLMDVRTGFDLLWRDGDLYTLKGERLADKFAEIGRLITPFIDAINERIRELGVQLTLMFDGITALQDRHLDYRIERKRRRTALRKKRNRG